VAIHDVSAWLPEEFNGPVIQKITQTSVIERIARKEPMTTLTRHVPRSGGMGMDIMGNGDAYTEDSSADDEVLLTARKFGRALSLAEEDIADTANLVNVLQAKRLDWATAYAKTVDNACLATTGAESVAGNIPFTSVYKRVRTSETGYTADTNYLLAGNNLGYVTFTIATDLVTTLQPHGLAINDKVVFGTITTTTGITAGTSYYVQAVPSTTTFKVAATASAASAIDLATGDGSAVTCTKKGVSYDNLSSVLSIVESGDWFDDANTVVVAHPKFKARFRGIKDTQGRPIFVAGTAGTPDTLFEYPVEWTLGARTHATADPAPTGNPLLIVGSKQALILGVRSGPESFIADGATGVGFSTDETKLKVRARRAFNISHVNAFAVLEDDSGL
jgi:hypothetical protein